ncbi:hypothetical protein [Mesorhizobium loti]|nr:hypothetical protein [Mesorhizobium loti]
MRYAVSAPATQAPQILEARPQKNVDFSSLRASAIKRFPKILAKLAE